MDKLLKPSLTMGVVDAASIKPEHVAKAPEAHKPAPKKKKAAANDAAWPMGKKHAKIGQLMTTQKFWPQKNIKKNLEEPRC